MGFRQRKSSYEPKSNKKGYIEYKLLADATYEVSKYTWNEEENNIVIPEEYKGKKVTSIGEHAFDTIKEYRNKKSDYNDYFCRAESIEMPSTIRIIKEGAFSNCRNIKKLELPEQLEEIGDSAFEGCGEEEIKFNDKLVKIENFAFSDNINITQVNMTNNITDIGFSTFEGCKNLKEVKLSNSFNSITGGENLFASCEKLEKIEFPKIITEIPRMMFCDCAGLKEVKLPKTVHTISGYAFENCKSLCKITIPDHVDIIEERAFFNCGNLNEIYIPKSVKKIEKDAISSKIKTIKCEASKKPEGWDDNWVSNESPVVKPTILFGQTR